MELKWNQWSPSCKIIRYSGEEFKHWNYLLRNNNKTLRREAANDDHNRGVEESSLVYGSRKKWKTNHNTEKGKSRFVDELQKESKAAKEASNRVERPESNLENKLKAYQDELNQPMSWVETDWWLEMLDSPEIVPYLWLFWENFHPR